MGQDHQISNSLPKNLRINFNKTVFKKIVYSLFERCQRITITNHLVLSFSIHMRISMRNYLKHILSLVSPLNTNSLIEFNTAKGLS